MEGRGERVSGEKGIYGSEEKNGNERMKAGKTDSEEQ